MIKRAFTMKLKPGGLAEYKKHHDNIWRELVEEIEKSGIGQITIFEADPVLFLYSEIYDEEAWDKLWGSEVHDRWSEVMNPLMEFRSDGIVDSSEVNLVFDLNTGAGS
jgi:L-rhamnose mutarotase